LEHCRGRHAADGVLRSAVDEYTTADAAMNITIKQVENFLRKIARFHSLHNGHSFRLADLGGKDTTNLDGGPFGGRSLGGRWIFGRGHRRSAGQLTDKDVENTLADLANVQVPALPDFELVGACGRGKEPAVFDVMRLRKVHCVLTVLCNSCISARSDTHNKNMRLLDAALPYR